MLPNVVIVGAPKCGTSSLFYWLADHPEVATSSVKETFYLVDRGPLARLGANFHDGGLDGYRSYFRHCDSNCRTVLEATVYYMYQNTARQVLASLDPLPQIVFMLRKPSSRIYSSYQYTKNNIAGLDKQVSFVELLDKLDRGQFDRVSDQVTSASYAYMLKNLIRHSEYVGVISDWVSTFGKNNVHLFLFEQMKADSRNFMKQVCQRLGISPEFYQTYEFEARNPTVHLRNQFLYRQLRRITWMIPRGRTKDVLRKAYLAMQDDARGEDIAPEDQRMLGKLDEYFGPYNRRLASTCSLDLSMWE